MEKEKEKDNEEENDNVDYLKESIVNVNPIKVSSKTADELDNDIEIENMKKIEAALFLSAKFLSIEELVMLTDINPLMLRELIERLVKKYNNSNSAIEIVIKNKLWKMDIASEYISMVNKIATGSSDFSKAEQETLAVIAYKQPVKQSVIINIRGNKAYLHIKHFIDIGLLHSKKVGHTKELNLSDDFFNYFHLQKKGEKGVDFEAEDKPDMEDESEDVEKVREEVIEDHKEKNEKLKKDIKEKEIKNDEVREEVIEDKEEKELEEKELNGEEEKLEEKEEAEINESNIENEINNENDLEGK